MLRLPLKVKGSENPSQTRFQKQVRESFAENIDSFSPNETVLVQTLFPNHPFIHMNASNFVVKISLPKTKLNKFLKSAKSMLSLLGKLVSVTLIPLAYANYCCNKRNKFRFL